MQVELRKHVGRNMATGKDETLKHYQVFADGVRVGFLGWGQGKKICFTELVTPLEQKDIEQKVRVLLESGGIICGEMQSSLAPDVPPELLTTPGDFEDYDDFN